MKHLLLIFLLLLPRPQYVATVPAISTSAGNNISVIEYKCGNTSGTNGCSSNAATTATINITSTLANDTIAIFTAGGSTGTAYGSVTDSGSQTYTQDANIQKTGIGAHIDATMWLKCGSASGITSVSWTYGSGDTAGGSKWIVVHLRGLAASACRDTSANFTTVQNTPYTTSSITPASGHNEWLAAMIVTAFGTSTTISATSPFTLEITVSAQPSNNNVGIFDQFVASTSGSYTASGTGTAGSGIYFPAIVALTH